MCYVSCSTYNHLGDEVKTFSLSDISIILPTVTLTVRMHRSGIKPPTSEQLLYVLSCDWKSNECNFKNLLNDYSSLEQQL